MKNSNRNIIFSSSIILTVLIIIASVVAMRGKNFYLSESENWQVQSAGQDMINIFVIVPCLLISTIFFWRGSKNAGHIWCGVMVYLAYTFTIYCFDIHFNRLFLLYCACLGLSLYTTGYYFYRQLCENGNTDLFPQKNIVRIIGIYFVFTAIAFGSLWLSEIIPATIRNRVPDSLVETGLFTNGVHVLDLSILLPGTFMSGVMLLRKRKIGLVLVPVLLTFFILMDITIGFLALLMNIRNVQQDKTVVIVMTCLAVLSGVLLNLFFQKTGNGSNFIGEV